MKNILLLLCCVSVNLMALVKDKPADMDYYMGYRIAKSYYENAKGKKQAVIDIIQMKILCSFWKKVSMISGFRPLSISIKKTEKASINQVKLLNFEKNTFFLALYMAKYGYSQT